MLRTILFGLCMLAAVAGCQESNTDTASRHGSSTTTDVHARRRRELEIDLASVNAVIQEAERDLGSIHPNEYNDLLNERTNLIMELQMLRDFPE